MNARRTSGVVAVGVVAQATGPFDYQTKHLTVTIPVVATPTFTG